MSAGTRKDILSQIIVKIMIYWQFLSECSSYWEKEISCPSMWSALLFGGLKMYHWDTRENIPILLASVLWLFLNKDPLCTKCPIGAFLVHRCSAFEVKFLLMYLDANSHTVMSLKVPLDAFSCVILHRMFPSNILNCFKSVRVPT